MRREMNAPNGLDEIMGQINEIPDLDNISISSGDTDRRSNSGITLNL